MTEFKQIIGRGTRLRGDYGKLYFNILDYTGSATRHFADPDFDGEPARHRGRDRSMTPAKPSSGQRNATRRRRPPADCTVDVHGSRRRPGRIITEPREEPRKFYVDGGDVEIVGHLVYELDADGKKLRVVKYTEYTGQKVRTLYPTRELRCNRPGPRPATRRAEVLRELTERGIDFDELAGQRRPAGRRPLRPALSSGLQRAAAHPPRARRSGREAGAGLLRPVRPEARDVLDACWRSTSSTASPSSALPDVLKVPPFDRCGSTCRDRHPASSAASQRLASDAVIRACRRPLSAGR